MNSQNAPYPVPPYVPSLPAFPPLRPRRGWMGCTTVKRCASCLKASAISMAAALVAGKHLVTFLDTHLMFWSPRSSSQFWIVLLTGWDTLGWSPRQSIWLPEHRSGKAGGPAWALSLPLVSICVLQLPPLGQRLGHDLNCEPPGSGCPDPHRKLLPYRKARISRGFLNQGKALKRVGKSLTSPGPFCYRCFSNQRKPWARVNAGKESL